MIDYKRELWKVIQELKVAGQIRGSEEFRKRVLDIRVRAEALVVDDRPRTAVPSTEVPTDE